MAELPRRNDASAGARSGSPLAVAKPFVRSVAWSQVADANKHLYPNGGLYNHQGVEKPLLAWLKAFREEIFI